MIFFKHSCNSQLWTSSSCAWVPGKSQELESQNWGNFAQTNKIEWRYCSTRSIDIDVFNIAKYSILSESWWRNQSSQANKPKNGIRCWKKPAEHWTKRRRRSQVSSVRQILCGYKRQHQKAERRSHRCHRLALGLTEEAKASAACAEKHMKVAEAEYPVAEVEYTYWLTDKVRELVLATSGSICCHYYD